MLKKIVILLGLLGVFAYGQTNRDMLIISSTMGKASQETKLIGIQRIGQQQGLKIDFKFDSEIKQKDYSKLLNSYRIVMFDTVAGAMSLKSMLNKYSDTIESTKETIVIPISLKKESINRKKISIEENIALYDYWYNGGEKNFINFIKYIKQNLLKKEQYKEIAPAIKVPKEGIYHPKNPNLAFKTLKEYKEFFQLDLKESTTPIIGIGMHRGSVTSGALSHINWLIKDLENKGAITIPYFTDISGKDPVGEKFLRENNKTVVDVIVNFQIMIIDHEPQKEFFKRVNVPILHALYYGSGDQKQWELDQYGVSFPMIPMTYIIPETIGFTDPLIVSAKDKKTKSLEPIIPQITSLSNKALNIAKLKHKENQDKKIALMFYNYPAGVKNMGASFMNTPRSLEELFKAFKKAGYTTEEKNASFFTEEATKGLKVLYDVDLYANSKKMLKEDSADLYPYDEYIKEFYKLPVETRTNMIRVWDYPLKSKMLIYKEGKWYFLIPRTKIGNIIVMPQPRRAEREDSIRDKNLDITREDSRLWHNPTVPISHSYLATYLYVRKSFKADAIIHFGTHGTQEWSPGKERGLSVGDDALAVLGDTPVVYPYITNNLAEGIQAKRRGRATLISHQTPPFGLTGTYKELSEIMDLVNQHKSIDDGMLKAELRDKIIEKTITMNIHKDVDFSKEEISKDFQTYLSKVEDYILGMSKQAQPLGMHTFGTYPKKEHLITTIIQILGDNFIEMVEEDKQYFSKNYKEFNSSKSYKIIEKYVLNNQNFTSLEDKDLQPYLEEARKYYQGFKNTKEIVNTLRALNGEYIETGVGGDPIRNPASIPTGNNMYGFDPSKVPSPTAFKTGSKLMKEFIANYYKENKKYPRKLTFNLWSLETMRHHGVLESQILYAMGVKPIWNETGISNKYIQKIASSILKNYLFDSLAEAIASLITMGRIEFVVNLLPNKWMEKPKKMIRHAKKVNKGQIEDVEIIPYSELKRPRVDVVISATGLYRDTFPQTMKLIAEAVKKVSELKEDNNYVRENSLALKKSLSQRSDINESEAQYLSTIRVFSNKTGDYGSGIDAIDESGRWESDQRLSQNYVQKLGYYFGTDEKRWSEKKIELDLYSKNLSGTEGIIFSRTSNLYGLLTSDDPFEYFGSIAMAVRNIDGKTPKTFISNLRDPKNAKTESTGKFLSKELRGRYFHPKWIKEMKAQGYSGTLGVLDVMNNLWGWQVVDPNVVRDDQWQEFVEVYINDKYNLKLQEWFKSQNPDALARIVQKMLEANRKGYFKTDDKTLKKLLQLYKELQKQYQVQTYNEKFKEYVEKKAIGFGLITPSGEMVKGAMQQPKKNSSKPTVRGQKLEKVAQKHEKQDQTKYYLLGAILFIMLSGMIYEMRRREI